MPFLWLFVEATVSSVPQDRALAEEARSYCGSCTGAHALDLAAAAFVPFPPLVPSFKPELRIYSSGDLPITSPPLLLLLLIPLQWGSTFNFSKSFHIHFLIWPLQQSCEAARGRIIIPIWKMGKNEIQCTEVAGPKWSNTQLVNGSGRASTESFPHPTRSGTVQETRSDSNWGHVNFHP